MKILHLMLACFYIDNYSYQENYLPKYHKKMGHEVEIIASLVSFDKNGKSIFLEHGSKYINEYGIPVTRLDYKRSPFSKKLRRYIGLEKEINRVAPDLIFIHGIQFLDISHVRKYCKQHTNVIVYADNHSDFSNSATNWISKKILHHIIWRRCAQTINPFVKKFYGVLPARVDFLINEYHLPRNKVELLVMGADDDSVNEAIKKDNVDKIREKYHVSKETFLIMTGGKIDLYKQQILLLMKAVNRIANKNVQLIVFGSVIPEMERAVKEQVSEFVKYIGWIPSRDTDSHYAAADLVVFPGRHSVFWEQVAALGIPMVCKYWAGTTHVDCGGNVRFLYNDDENEIEKAIRDSIINYSEMLKSAREGCSKFLYSSIAKDSIYGREK